MRIYLSLALLLAACALTAFGSTTYTGSSPSGRDTTDWNNFLSDNSSLSFSNITFSNGTWTTGSDGSVIDTATSLNFVGCFSNWVDCTSNSSGVAVGNSYNASWLSGPILSNAAAGQTGFPFSTITISLPANVFAIGLDVLHNSSSGFNGPPFGVIVNGNDGSTMSTGVETALPGSVFFGYSSATAISSLTIFTENTGTVLGIDNVDVGFLTGSSGNGTSSDPPGTAPEASTMLLVASGLFMLGFARKLPCFSR